MEILQQPDASQQSGIAAIELTPDLVRKRRGQLRIIYDRFVRNRAAVAGVIVLSIIILLAIFAPVITHQTATYDPANSIPQNPKPSDLLAGPSWAHPMGTDELGRDFFARMLFGAQVSLLVGFSSMFVAMGIGATLGAIAGYYGGWIDNVLMRVVDAMLALPYLLLLFVLSIIFSNGSVGTVVFIIAILAWPATARIVRGEFLALKHQEFLMATRTLGAGDLRLILRHILPNAAGPIIVNATLLVGLNIINESVLSFFGFGLTPPQSSWGVLLGQSQTFFNAAPRMLYLPGFAILITVLCFNLIGDGLRDALDPHLTQR
ncbi:MAG TPA: ABC transporter permease [Ktedonobacterales bacterium]|jgi:peptide/nickel transport system permease protein|nr:ABC transporter permease [Ktedonobacterales bacterium]